jgi:hypothetical protein
MNLIYFLRKTNTVLIFVLLVAVILVGGYLIARPRIPLRTIHVSVDSMHFHKK